MTKTTPSRHAAAASLAAAATALLLAGFARPAGAQTPDAQQTPPPATTPDATTTPGQQTDDQNPPPPRRRSRFRIGPELGLFLPTSSKTRDRFGDSWVSFGIGLGRISRAAENGRPRPVLGLSVLTKSRGDNRAIIVPLGLEYRVPLTRATSESATVPYVGVSGDLVFADLRVREVNENISGLRVTGGASAYVGTTFSDSAYIEARYRLIARTRGYDLSGLNLTAGFRF